MRNPIVIVIWGKGINWKREHPNAGEFTKILIVIANGTKWNEAIATARLCDCFASFHYARNDELCFYTFDALIINSHKSLVPIQAETQMI